MVCRSAAAPRAPGRAALAARVPRLAPAAHVPGPARRRRRVCRTGPRAAPAARVTVPPRRALAVEARPALLSHGDMLGKGGRRAARRRAAAAAGRAIAPRPARGVFSHGCFASSLVSNNTDFGIASVEGGRAIMIWSDTDSGPGGPLRPVTASHSVLRRHYHQS